MSPNAPLATASARRARAHLLDLTRHGLADPDFLQEISRELSSIVPFSASFWSASDPLTTLATAPGRVENLAGQCERFWEREFLVQDFNLFRDLARAKSPVASLFRATAEQPTRSVRYRELNRSQGFGDELRSVFRSGNATWGMVSLWREEGHPAFSVAEEALIADLSPAIAGAFRRAALVQASVAGTHPEAPGLLVFDRRGALEEFNDQGEAWLRELPSPSTAGRSDAGASVPTGILTVVAFAHAIDAGVERGVARAHLRSRSGRWLVVQGFPLRGPQDMESRTAVVIEPANASAVAPIIVGAYDLTQREQQIIPLIARGLATAQIADQLYLSRHTVRDYVKSIFEKMGVSSRGELVARLFAEQHQEPLHDSISLEPARASAPLCRRSARRA